MHLREDGLLLEADMTGHDLMKPSATIDDLLIRPGYTQKIENRPGVSLLLQARVDQLPSQAAANLGPESQLLTGFVAGGDDDEPIQQVLTSGQVE